MFEEGEVGDVVAAVDCCCGVLDCGFGWLGEVGGDVTDEVEAAPEVGAADACVGEVEEEDGPAAGEAF